MSDSDKVKSQAVIDTSDSDSDVSDSEFRNVAKKPRLDDQGTVSLLLNIGQLFSIFSFCRSLGQDHQGNLLPLPRAVLLDLEMNGREMKRELRRKSMIDKCF